MRRRRFLAALGGAGTIGFGGLLALRASKRRTLSVPTVESYDLSFRVDEEPSQEPTPLEVGSFENPDVIRQAIDGGYETSSPPEWVADALNGESFVRADGDIYRLEDDLPSLRIQLRPVEAGGVDGEIADLETAIEAFHLFERNHWFLARAQLSPVRHRPTGDAVREFFRTYDALVVHGQPFAFDVELRDPGGPYSISAERVTRAEYRDSTVFDLSAADRELADRFRSSLDSDRYLHGATDVPRELALRLQANEFVALDGDVHRIRAWHLGHVPISLYVDVVDASLRFKNPGRLTFALENAGSHPIELGRAPQHAFGSLAMRSLDGEAEFPLYAEDDQGSSIWPSEQSTTDGPARIEPGDRITAEYWVGGNVRGIPVGRYEVRDTVRIGRRFPTVRYPFHAEFEIS